MAQAMQEREDAIEINCKEKWDRDDGTWKGFHFERM